MKTFAVSKKIMSVLLTAVMVFGMVILPYDLSEFGSASAATVEGSEINNVDKLNAFSGNAIWTDACEDPSATSSTLSLVKMYTKVANSEHYFYLPETANLSALPIFFGGYSSVKIGDYQITSGTCYNFMLDSAKVSVNGATAYMFPLTINGASAGKLFFMRSDSTALYLNLKEPIPVTTNATNAAGVSISNKDNFETKGKFATTEDGKKFQEGAVKKIKGRGNASWSFSFNNFGKYSFNITLEEKTKLFSGLNKGKKFCLLANNGDEALMRNVFTFSLGEKIGLNFVPTFRYIDLYDRGDYIGSYMITDKIEINSQSVDLSINYDDLNEFNNPGVNFDSYRACTNGNLYENDSASKGYQKWINMAEPTLNEDGTPLPESVTAGDGGFLLEVEYNDRFVNELCGFISSKGQCVVMKYPEYASKNQVNFAYNKFADAEAVVYDRNSTYERINAVIDVESFLKTYLIQELSKNCDSGLSSYYIYYDTAVDNRLHAAPLWDFDMGYGQLNDTRLLSYDSNGQALYANYTRYDEWQTKYMGISWHKNDLNIQAAFANNVNIWNLIKEYWVAEDGFYNNVMDMLYNEYEGSIPYYIEQINGTAAMNESRWEFIKRDVVEAFNNTGKTYSQTTRFFTDWTTNRLNWLNGSMFDQNAPRMDINDCVGGNGTVHITGWAYDADVPEKSIDVKIDINGETHYIKADLESQDVTNVFGVQGNHRFDVTIETGQAGYNLPVTVTAQNVNTRGSDFGYTTSMSRTASIGIGDSSIQKLTVGRTSRSGFLVTYQVPNNAIVARANIAVWTDNNGQDDLRWYNVNPNDGSVAVFISTADHNNETGVYHIHPYIYDNTGRSVHTRATVDIPADDSPIKKFESRYNGNKYVIYDSAYNWENAKAYCESLGGHLATVTSEKEWNAIKELAAKYNSVRLWLGAENVDRSENGRWEWVTKEPFGFDAWGINPSGVEQPDGGAKGEYYLGIWSSQSKPYYDSFNWNDYQLDGSITTFGFICEYDAQDIKVNASTATTTLPQQAVYGDTVSFTVTPEKGYSVDKVFVNGAELSATDGTYSFTMPVSTANVEVTTTRNTYAVVEVSSNCTTNLPANAVFGDEVSFSVNADSGYSVVSVSVNGEELASADGIYKFTMPADDVAIAIETTKVAYSITATKGEYTVNVPATAIFGDTVKFTVTPNTGYAISKVTVNGEVITAQSGEYSFTMPAKDVAIVIEATKVVYSITATKGEYTVNAPATATFGDTVKFTVTPNTGYAISKVTVNGEVVTAQSGEYSFTMPAKNTSIAVETSRLSYSISTTKGEYTVNVPATATFGDTVKFTVKPNTGYAISKVTVNGEVVTAQSGEYSFTMPAKNVTVSVECGKVDYSIILSGANFTTNLPTVAQHEDMLMFEIKADQDYKVDKVTFNGVDITDASGYYSIVMPAKDVKIDVTTSLTVSLGDVNKDGRINVKDATLICKYLAGITKFDKTQQIVADVNGDGVVSILDVTQIQKFCAHLIDSF